MFVRRVVPGSTSRLAMVDHTESYGRHLLADVVRTETITRCLDIGCGSGNDLAIVSEQHPKAELIGIDFGDWNTQTLQQRGITPVSCNVEAERLPFADNSFDLIIANQVMEHTKEIFWINHEIFRTLRVGGTLFIGVPNVLSLHNRLLMMFGIHPTQHKLTSAHVRPFSRRDVVQFYKTIGGSFCTVERFWGSQFYPFPRPVARVLSRMLPGLSFSIFFLVRKTGPYHTAFIEWPSTARLETNFFTGPNAV